MPDAGATGGIAVERLRSFVERVERLEEDRANINADIREVYSEAKGGGFDIKALRAVVRMRKLSPADRAEQKLILETYARALDM